jgi:hypothetical protein
MQEFAAGKFHDIPFLKILATMRLRRALSSLKGTGAFVVLSAIEPAGGTSAANC